MIKTQFWTLLGTRTKLKFHPQLYNDQSRLVIRLLTRSKSSYYFGNITEHGNGQKLLFKIKENMRDPNGKSVVFLTTV